MDIIKGKVEKMHQEEDQDDEVETAESHQEEEVPAWMKKGMFAQPGKSSHGVTFEEDTVEEKKQHKKNGKHNKKDKKGKKHHGKKDKKNHEKKDQHKKKHCCAFMPLCFIALVAGHLYTLKKMGQSLYALEIIGGTMQGYWKEQRAKKAAAKAVVVADEEQVPVVPQTIVYSFDEHLDKEEYPVVSEPINYSINESTTQM